MKVRLIFAWYDIWIGVFIDRPKRRIYIFPVPCLGIVIESKIYQIDRHGSRKGQ